MHHEQMLWVAALKGLGESIYDYDQFAGCRLQVAGAVNNGVSRVGTVNVNS